MGDMPYRIWITYVVIPPEGHGSEEHFDAPERRELFEFPRVGDTGATAMIGGMEVTMGPSIGEMLTAIREKTGLDAHIIRTDPA